MAFWIVVAGLTAVVIAIIVRPFFQSRDSKRSADYDVEVYKSQMRELERERSNGLISGQEADAAKSEIAKRLLAADAKRNAQSDAML